MHATIGSHAADGALMHAEGMRCTAALRLPRPARW
jgi:hypothetical protein